MKFETSITKRIAIQVSIFSLLLAISGLGLFGPRTTSFAASSSSPSFDNVQVFVTPQNTSLNVFSMTVYNTTGGIVASSQSSYPAFSFELPEGNYVFTVTAGSSNGYSTSPPVPLGSTAANQAIVYRGPYGYQQEYGYSMVTVNSSKSITISTTELSSVQSVTLTVLAKYANGTLASGASVYASVVGGDSWYYPGSTLSMSNQTGSNGSVTLIVPDVPLEITAWEWLPVNLPQTQVTTQVTVAGESVNVTAYWQPTLVGVAGSAVITPPFQQTNITLTAQQQNFWAYPQGVVSTPPSIVAPGVEGASSQGTAANSPSGIPASVLAQEQGGSTTQSPGASQSLTSSPVTVTLTTTASAMPAGGSSASSSIVLEGGIVAAVVIALAAVVLALRRK